MDKANANRDISRIENVGQEDVDYFRALGYLCRRKYPDYLCSRSDLESLKGNKFKSQRASCNYFIKHCDCRVLKFAPGHKSACLDLFDEWARERGGRITDDLYRGMLEDSRLVIKEALSVSRRLGLEGIIVKSEGNIKGFTLGYRLNDDIFCVLYEITDLSVKGLAQFIFRRFSAELKKYTYINIMDDSGLDNLRKAKLSYKPERLIPAYIATRDA